jgi:hypothetical protein
VDSPSFHEILALLQPLHLSLNVFFSRRNEVEILGLWKEEGGSKNYLVGNSRSLAAKIEKSFKTENSLASLEMTGML